MQVMGVTGRIYGLKSSQTTKGTDKATFRVGVRKQFVTDQDKQDGKTMTFIPMMAIGPTAKFISTYFNDGDNIAIGAMEYQTYRSQNADPANTFDDMHSFKVDKAGFVSDGQQGGGSQPRTQAPARNQGYAQQPTNQPQYAQAGPPPQYTQAPAQPQYAQSAPPAQPQYAQAGPPPQYASTTPMEPNYISDDDLPF